MQTMYAVLLDDTEVAQHNKHSVIYLLQANKSQLNRTVQVNTCDL